MLISLGSISSITNELGERAERRTYHPFGKISSDDTLDTTLTEETKGAIRSHALTLPKHFADFGARVVSVIPSA